MDKNRILEITFETIKESTEWGLDCDNKNYGYWIDGVVAMTESLLDELDKTVSVTNEEKLDNKFIEELQLLQH